MTNFAGRFAKTLWRLESSSDNHALLGSERYDPRFSPSENEHPLSRGVVMTPILDPLQRTFRRPKSKCKTPLFRPLSAYSNGKKATMDVFNQKWGHCRWKWNVRHPQVHMARMECEYWVSRGVLHGMGAWVNATQVLIMTLVLHWSSETQSACEAEFWYWTCTSPWVFVKGVVHESLCSMLIRQQLDES